MNWINLVRSQVIAVIFYVALPCFVTRQIFAVKSSPFLISILFIILRCTVNMKFFDMKKAWKLRSLWRGKISRQIYFRTVIVTKPKIYVATPNETQRHNKSPKMGTLRCLTRMVIFYSNGGINVSLRYYGLQIFNSDTINPKLEVKFFNKFSWWLYWHFT